MTGVDLKNKKEHRFYLFRPGDGRYVFKCNSPKQRDEWTMVLDKVITVRPHNMILLSVILFCLNLHIVVA